MSNRRADHALRGSSPCKTTAIDQPADPLFLLCVRAQLIIRPSSKMLTTPLPQIACGDSISRRTPAMDLRRLSAMPDWLELKPPRESGSCVSPQSSVRLPQAAPTDDERASGPSRTGCDQVAPKWRLMLDVLWVVSRVK
jgi:hypothetical protein